MTFYVSLWRALAITCLVSASSGIAQEQDIAAELIFRYGDSCTQLTPLTRVELVGVTHLAYAEQFNYFCKPDGIYRCEDYNSLLAGMGQLEDNGQTSCRYLPR